MGINLFVGIEIKITVYIPPTVKDKVEDIEKVLGGNVAEAEKPGVPEPNPDPGPLGTIEDGFYTMSAYSDTTVTLRNEVYKTSISLFITRLS